MRLLISHKCEKYDFLRAFIQNSNQQIEHDITTPYKKIWDRLIVSQNDTIQALYTAIAKFKQWQQRFC